jgi:outer membrane protein assembly factor BamB
MTTVLETSPVPGVRFLYGLSLAAAIASGAFCLVFVAVLLYQYNVAYHPDIDDAISSNDPSYRQGAADSFNLLPTDYKAFLVLKHQLAADKTNETLKEQIRQLDQKLRIDFFKRRQIIIRTSPLLLFAAIVFFIATRTATVLRREIPNPAATPIPQKSFLATASLLAVSTLLIGLAMGLALVPESSFERQLTEKLAEKQLAEPFATAEKPPQAAGLTQTAAEPETPITEADFAKNWVAFRGFDGNGTGQSEKPPIHWNGKTGEHVIWKSDVPLPGKSSPIIWENKLFLTGADEKKRQVYCYQTDTGTLLWTVDVPETPESNKPVNVSEDTGFAAPTAAADGHRVFAVFANGDVAAIDFSGKIVWNKNLGVPESSYGYASSPAIFFDRLIVQYDVGDGSSDKSKLIAFDTKTGNVLWEIPRQVPNSWSSPTIKKIDGQYQIITCADPFVIAYNPDDGKEIWRCKCLTADVGPSAVAMGNTILTTNQAPRTTAIDATGTGDVTESKTLWKGSNALPDTPSPLATKDRFITFDSGGYMTAYDPTKIEKGKAKFWELEVGGGESSFYSSPLLVGNYIYVFDKTEDAAKAFVIDLSQSATSADGGLTDESAKSMVIATNPMPEPCVASPAVINNRLFIRGAKTVFCIGE